MNRRSFLATLGATGFVAGLPAAGDTSNRSDETAMRSRVDLNGKWERYLHGQLYDRISVPSSHRPSGIYSLQRSFLLPRLTAGQRVYLHFEAITYCARASVNGVLLGSMGPYVPYEFEFTAHAKEGVNQVEVAIADLCPFENGEGQDEIALGVNPGWEAYSGIIRDVYVELRPAAFIDNVRLAYRLDPGYSRASCEVRVYLSSTKDTVLTVEATLNKGDVVLARASKQAKGNGTSEVDLSFEVDHPELWSPERPNLYELRVQLTAGKDRDTWSSKTGFRELTAKGREFQLNGKKLVLNGVCRHDMWKDQGFTLSRTQQEQDMRMIKALGCNFVRLVHYPHDRHIVELADELGLLVTEEPGYWIMDFRSMPHGEIELGYRIMERTIKRDWNSPSVFAWLLANECRWTVEVLKEGKRRCNQLDPIQRFVSAANDRPKEEAKPIFEEAGMDFFDQHPYTFDMERFERETDYMGPGKPMTFTEWGGKAGGQSEPIMEATVDKLIMLIEKGKLSGHSFWSWQDVRQYSRVDPEMNNGVLESGAVTEAREPRAVVYMALERLIEKRHHRESSSDIRPEVLPIKHVSWSEKSVFHPIDLEEQANRDESDKAWQQFEQQMAAFWPTNPRTKDQWSRTGEHFELWKAELTREISVAGVPFRIPAVKGSARPLVCLNSFAVTVPIAAPCKRLHLLGNVTFPSGYPLEGKQGESIGTYIFHTASGKNIEVPLRLGYEVCSSNLIHEGTRIQPVVTEAQPVLLYRKDYAREQYQVLLYSSPFIDSVITQVTCKLVVPNLALAIFAVTGEEMKRMN